MKNFLIILTIFMSGSYAHAGFEEYVARCVEVGKKLFTSRVYSLHVNETKDKGILIAIDTDLLTEAVYGDIKFTGTRPTGIKITMPSGKAVFKGVPDDPGGNAIINGKKYVCDFAQ